MSPHRGLAALAALAVRRPRRTLAVASFLLVLALGTAASRLEVRTSNLDLIDPDLPEVRRFRDFAAELGTPNTLVVALSGDDPRELRAASDRLEPRLARVPGARGAFGKLPLPAETLEVLAVDPYFAADDGGMLFLFVQPDDPTSAAATLAPFVAAVRRVLDEDDLAARGVSAGLTGMPAYALDDRDVIQHDVSSLSLVSAVLIALLFLMAFRSFRRPLLAMATLLVAVGVTLGAVALYPGHLTLLSAFFASILLGLGVDYGIHVVDRTEELLDKGLDLRTAVPRAVAATAPGLATGAGTTAAVFFAMRASGFRGFEELGVVAGSGVLLCLLAMTTVLPAALVLGAPRDATSATTARPVTRRLGRVLEGLRSRPAAVALTAVAIAGLFAGAPSFDGNYLDLQPQDSEAARIEREMVRRSDFSPQFAAFVADSRERLAELRWELADDTTVGAVRSIADFEIAGVPGLYPEVPAALLETFVSPAGSFAVHAYPAGDIWDPGQQEEFLAHMRAIDPEATGMPFLGKLMVERSWRAVRITGTLAAGILGIFVALDFQRAIPSLLAMLPAVLTVGATLTLMRLFGWQLNPLNIMALPVVLGIAVDDGVHLVHRFLAEHGDLEATLGGTGRSVVLTSLTTLAAFGTLGFSAHRGLASFAHVLTLGVTLALLLSLVVLPELLDAVRHRLLADSHSPSPSAPHPPAPSPWGEGETDPLG